MVSKLRIVWKQTVSPFGGPPLLGLLHLCMAGAVSGGLGQLYVQRPDPTADGEGVPAEGASGVVLVQQVCRPFNLSLCHRWRRRTSPNRALRSPTRATSNPDRDACLACEMLGAVISQADVLLSVLNLVRFVLLRDRPTATNPNGLTGLSSKAELRQLKKGVVGPLLLRLEYLQAAMNRVQDEQAQWAMTRMGVVEMVVQRLDEMIPVDAEEDA